LASATLTLNQGQATKTFLVNIQNDTAVEGSETVELSLANATGATIVGPNPAVLTITDNEPVLQFVAPKYVVAETAPEARITVRRTGALTSPATVDYQITGGTATDGSDYTVSTGTLSFAPGKPTQTLSVGIVNDSVDEPNETVNLGLVNPSSGYGIGTPGQAVLTINDNDTAGEVQFSVVAYSVGEGGGLATIAVTRTGTSELATADYATSDETATTAGSDYTGTAGTLSFGLGETTATIQVPINDDTLSEGNEYLTLTLGNPGGGLVLGSRSAATLWIVDDD
jgi:hypothetical protein